MMRSAFKAFAEILFICAISSAVFSHASCSIDVVMVKGRIEHPPTKGLVRMQLVYPKQELGESGEVTVDGESFRIQIPFLTQSRAPGLLGIREKCGRKPERVLVTLVEDQERGREYDRVSLDLAKDFKMADPSAYALRSEIVLHGPPDTPPIQ
jgi:hypothetical protein